MSINSEELIEEAWQETLARIGPLRSMTGLCKDAFYRAARRRLVEAERVLGRIREAALCQEQRNVGRPQKRWGRLFGRRLWNRR